MVFASRGLDGIPDPEGLTVELALPDLGFRGSAGVRLASRGRVRGDASTLAYHPP
jgi:phosphoribosylformylglycinamidine (FGAM) synthase PurS component